MSRSRSASREPGDNCGDLRRKLYRTSESARGCSSLKLSDPFAYNLTIYILSLSDAYPVARSTGDGRYPRARVRMRIPRRTASIRNSENGENVDSFQSLRGAPKSRREKLNAFFFTVVKFAIGWNRNPPRSNIASRSSGPRDARRRSARTEGPAKRGDFNAPQSARRSDLFSRFYWIPNFILQFFFFVLTFANSSRDLTVGKSSTCRFRIPETRDTLVEVWSRFVPEAIPRCSNWKKLMVKELCWAEKRWLSAQKCFQTKHGCLVSHTHKNLISTVFI